MDFRKENSIYGFHEERPVRIIKASYKYDEFDEVVIKCFKNNIHWNEEELNRNKKQMEREATMLEKLKTRSNIILQYKGVSFDENLYNEYFGYIVFESLICSVQNLIEALNPLILLQLEERNLNILNELKLTEEETNLWRNEMILQCSSALAFIHSKGIIHRDIKSSNILITRTKNRLSFKIADFGISIFEDEAKECRSQSCGTKGYMAPEIRVGVVVCEYSRLSDVYAFAVTVNEVMKGEIAAGNEEKPIVFEVINNDYDENQIRKFFDIGLTENLAKRKELLLTEYNVDDNSYFYAINQYLANKIKTEVTV